MTGATGVKPSGYGTTALDQISVALEIKSGKLLATGDYNGFAQGCIGTMIAIRTLRKQPVVSEIVLKPTVITKDNYQPFDVALETRTCPSWDEAAKFATK